MSRPGEFTAGDVLAAAEVNALPGGSYGYAQVTADQSGISTEADLTGLSVTVVLPASRRILISGNVMAASSAGDVRSQVYIKESTTYLAASHMSHPISGGSGRQTHQPMSVLTPSSGSHTYKLSALIDSGTMTAASSTTAPAFILVQDIGSA